MNLDNICTLDFAEILASATFVDAEKGFDVVIALWCTYKAFGSSLPTADRWHASSMASAKPAWKSNASAFSQAFLYVPKNARMSSCRVWG